MSDWSTATADEIMADLRAVAGQGDRYPTVLTDDVFWEYVRPMVICGIQGTWFRRAGQLVWKRDR